MRYGAAALVMALASGPVLAAQTPVPFPKPGDPRTAQAPSKGEQPPGKVQPPAQKPGAAAPEAAPTDASLGMPIYPSAEFLSSYDAGRGQRYYLFGTNTPFAQIV